VENIKFSNRQEKIIELVKKNAPITSEHLAKHVGVTRAALRSDLSVLTMTGILEAKPKVGYIYSKKPSYSLLYEYIRNITVEDIMSKPVIVDENTTLYDAIVNLFLNDVGTLFIENNGVLTGAVSRKDFLKIAIGGTDMRKVPVGIIMTRMPNIVFVQRKDSVYVAAEKIMEHQVDSLPVVEQFGGDSKDKFKILGKVSKTNITRLFVKIGKNK
jgi:CBS domain-containing protein